MTPFAGLAYAADQPQAAASASGGGVAWLLAIALAAAVLVIVGLWMRVRVLRAEASSAGIPVDTLRQALMHVPDPVAIITNDYMVAFANEAYATRHGKRIGDIYHKVCHEALFCQGLPCPGCPVQKTLNHNAPTTTERTFSLGDGSVIWEETRTWPIHGPGGNITHVIEYSRDVSGSRRIEAEKQQILARLEHLSRHDYLTGLLNRRSLVERLDYEFSRSERYGTPLSVFIVDIDGLKGINERLGHNAGDSALISVADAITRAARRTDILSRHGGDEFLCVLSLTPVEGAVELAHRVSSTVAALQIVGPWDTPFQVTVSIGVAAWTPAMKSVEDLILAADRALKEAMGSRGGGVSVAK